MLFTDWACHSYACSKQLQWHHSWQMFTRLRWLGVVRPRIFCTKWIPRQEGSASTGQRTLQCYCGENILLLGACFSCGKYLKKPKKLREKIGKLLFFSGSMVSKLWHMKGDTCPLKLSSTHSFSSKQSTESLWQSTTLWHLTQFLLELSPTRRTQNGELCQWSLSDKEFWSW